MDYQIGQICLGLPGLIKKIREFNKKIPIFVGGQAFNDRTKAKFDANIIDSNDSLIKLPRILQKSKKS